MFTARNMPILVAAPILTEAHSLIVHRLGPITAQRWLQEVFDSTAIVLPSERDFRAALQTIQRLTDQSITLTDAILAVLSRRLRLPVWTCDHHFDIMQVEVWREI